MTGEAGFVADASEASRASTGRCWRSPLVLVARRSCSRPTAPRSIALVPLARRRARLPDRGRSCLRRSWRPALSTSRGQATAILIVLMFGAGTDYCLLLVSRYREELRAGEHVARRRWRAPPSAAAGAIVSAGATVIAAMLVLLLADFRATREMGPALALGIAVMVVAGLTLLPALLSVLGRRAFWPARPADGRAGAGPGVWARAGRLVRARPAAVTAVVGRRAARRGALGNLDARGSLDFTESFRDPPESVQGLELIRDELRARARGAARSSSWRRRGCRRRSPALGEVERRRDGDADELLARPAAGARRRAARRRPVLAAGAGPDAAAARGWPREAARRRDGADRRADGGDLRRAQARSAPTRR